MFGTILLNYSDNTKQVEQEEKNRFLKDLLEQMGVPIREFWGDELSLSVDQKIKLRNIFNAFKIRVIDDYDSQFSIFVENEKIGSFDKPTYKLKRDLDELDPKKQFYVEMTIVCNSIFENSDISENEGKEE